MKLEFTLLALDDLASIEQYTRETWGEQQADLYLAAIEQSLSSLLDNPELGTKRPDILPGCRCLLSQKHLIFYRTKDDKVTILGIPHCSMDISVHMTINQR